ncbi:hypothetical protein DPM19_13140 [Actinomadura craniellae]|uniref:Uncharacterized protein n=2 Tax=Actinomadura craniellae TaxID=2231787 RepID=A0A365H6R6_9ACTN|nr:hypothetical protein DPM19_13140 [Actinomadura craniellae]
MAQALDTLKRFLRRPILDPMCPCCDPREALDILHGIVTALPPRSRPPVTALVEPLGERYRARTLPDPRLRPDQPWWWRRVAEI